MLAGYVFYLFNRQHDPVFGAVSLLPTGTPLLPAEFSSSLPTFIHVLAMSLASYALLGAKLKFRYPVLICWVFINLVFEVLQSKGEQGIVNGTFDLNDMLIIIFAGLVYLLLTTYVDRTCQYNDTNSYKFKPILFPLLAAFGITSILASYEEHSDYTPVYMSYEELRAPLKVETNRSLRATGKIYLYQDYLIISEPNKGIHIYDNTDKASPVHKAFVKVPGNLDIAVRDGYLYADSFVDLVVIDINDIDNIVDVHRVESMFPYDPYQALPKEKQDYDFSWDENRGVIIDVIYRPIIY